MAKQKRTVTIAFGVILTLLLGATSFAATVNPEDWVKLDYALNNTHYGGGAFQATDLTSKSSWTTFCLEVNEYFSPGHTYKVDTVGLIAMGGGAGVASPPGTTSITSSGTGDPISYQTAFLYDAFLNHASSLPSGGYTGTGAQQESLQLAFWYLENEKPAYSSTKYTNNNLANLYIAYALGYTETDDFGVRVFNPVTVNSAGAITARNQSMLYQSVPEAGALLLFGTGLVGLVGYRRVRRMQ